MEPERREASVFRGSANKRSTAEGLAVSFLLQLKPEAAVTAAQGHTCCRPRGSSLPPGLRRLLGSLAYTCITVTSLFVATWPFPSEFVSKFLSLFRTLLGLHSTLLLPFSV